MQPVQYASSVETMATMHFKNLLAHLSFLTTYYACKCFMIIFSCIANLPPFWVDFYFGETTLRTSILAAVSHFIDLTLAFTSLTGFLFGL